MDIEVGMALNKRAEVIINRTPITGLLVAAHPDDAEIMGFGAITKYYDAENEGLCVVIVTNGAGSPRNGIFAGFSDEKMIEARRLEQIKAATVGNYAALIMLNYTSGEVKDIENPNVAKDLAEIIRSIEPKEIYTHNPADKHSTHIGVMKNLIKAVQSVEKKPQKLYGCECWRGLDWVCDDEKVFFNVTGREELLNDLLTCFVSQNNGGKRYDIAADGRMKANATLSASHSVDKAKFLSLGIDMTELVEKGASVRAYIEKKLNRLTASVLDKLEF